MPTKSDIEDAVKTAVKYDCPSELELAFFGGSFTMIEREKMLFYLDVAKTLVEEYGLHGIRFSTRPDGINEEVMRIIEGYPVTAIELGAQSMDDGVLIASMRGHTATDTEKAAGLIKRAGKELVLQMMVGMPESCFEKELDTAKKLAGLLPDAVRIYPVLVLEGTELARQYRAGEYEPIALEKAVETSAELISFFEDNDISVIKVGLQAEEGFDSKKTLVAGPYHQAFRELCEGSLYLKKILKDYRGGDAVILCNSRELSKVKGHKKENELRLKELYPTSDFIFQTTDELSKGEIVVKRRA